MANRARKTLKNALVSTTAASTLLTGAMTPDMSYGSPSLEDEAIVQVQPSEFAPNPVTGPDAPLFPLSATVHMGGMESMMKMSVIDIFHELASLPAEERVLRVGVITQDSPPEFLAERDVRNNEYAPLRETAIASVEAMLDQFTAITGIRTEVVPNASDAPILIGAFTEDRKERQRKEKEANPDLVVADGFATWLGLLPDSSAFRAQELLMLHQDASGKVSYHTAWHELGHRLGLAHSADEYGTLGNWHEPDGETFDQTPPQQRAISMMAYGSYLDGPGPLDIYLIHQAMREAGLTPPETVATQTRLSASPLSDAPETFFPAQSERVQPDSLLEGTNQSDLLVTEAGLCGLTRYELYDNGKLYCVVEGDYADVSPGDGDDMVLTSRLQDQTIALGEGDNSVAILDEDSGEKTIRYDTHAEGQNNLVFTDEMLQQGTVSAKQDGDSIVLDFMYEGECKTRVTLVDQLKEGQEPLIGEIMVIFGEADSNLALPVKIDIRQAESPEDFEALFNQQMETYRTRAESEYRTSFVAEEDYQQAYGEGVRHIVSNWEAGRRGSGQLALNVTYQPPTAPVEEKEPPRLPLTKSPVQAILRRDQTTGAGESWEERIRNGGNPSATRTP